MHDVMTRPPRSRAAATQRLLSPGPYDTLLELQRAAGNRAVTALLSSRPAPAAQRCGPVAPEACPCHDRDEAADRAAPVAQPATGTKRPQTPKKTITSTRR
jgi:hypothetical protein